MELLSKEGSTSPKFSAIQIITEKANKRHFMPKRPFLEPTPAALYGLVHRQWTKDVKKTSFELS